MLYPTDFREDGDTMNDFSKNVYLAVQKIPRGKVTNYGCIAFLAGKPRAARGVGYLADLLVPLAQFLPLQGFLVKSLRFLIPKQRDAGARHLLA